MYENFIFLFNGKRDLSYALVHLSESFLEQKTISVDIFLCVKKSFDQSFNLNDK